MIILCCYWEQLILGAARGSNDWDSGLHESECKPWLPLHKPSPPPVALATLPGTGSHRESPCNLWSVMFEH